MRSLPLSARVVWERCDEFNLAAVVVQIDLTLCMQRGNRPGGVERAARWWNRSSTDRPRLTNHSPSPGYHSEVAHHSASSAAFCEHALDR